MSQLDKYLTDEQQDQLADALGIVCSAGIGEVSIRVSNHHVRFVERTTIREEFVQPPKEMVYYEGVSFER